MAAETALRVRAVAVDPGKKVAATLAAVILVAEALLVAILAVLAHVNPVTAGAEAAQVVSVTTAVVRVAAVAGLR